MKANVKNANANAQANAIENMLASRIRETNFAMPCPAIPAIAQILAQGLPNPSEIHFYQPHLWAIDSAHGVQTLSIILDTSYQEFPENAEEALLNALNTQIPSDYGMIRITASDTGDTIILITISYLE